MDDNNRVPAPADDDLLDWMPPELVERARVAAQRDAKTAPPPKAKKKRVDYTKPPKGKHRGFSLAAWGGGALLLLAGMALTLIGGRGAQALEQKGRLWLMFWLAGQTATLCVYLLFLLPLDKKLRRPALFAALCAGLIFGLGASVASMRPAEGESAPPSLRIVLLLFAMLLVLLFSPNLWLALGLLRRKTTEKFSALMGGVNLAISLIGLLTTLGAGEADASTLVTALGAVQGLCFLCLLTAWPVLDRPVLDKT